MSLGGHVWVIMATRSYRPTHKRTPVTDGSQVLEKHAHDIATEQLIPRIEQRNKMAVETVPIKIFFYQAMRAGRRCSCFDIETSPDGMCRTCFGTGIVGGYSKYGTTTQVLDITYPNLRTSNIIPDWKNRRKPTPFVLIDGARYGSVEARIPLTSNIGEIDALSSDYWIEPGTNIKAYVKAPADQTWVLLTRNNVKQRLFNPWIDIRVVMSRESPKTPTPYLKSVYLRYRNITDNIIKANILRVGKSDAFEELGLIDNWQVQTFWMDSTLKSITTEDFLASVEGDSRWKIFEAKEFAPHGQLVSWDIDAKVVQEHQPFVKVPR